jgi:hypothetical protein
MLSKEVVTELARTRHVKVHHPGTDMATAMYSDCDECRSHVEKEERAGDFWRMVYVNSLSSQLPAENADDAVKEAKIRGYL